MAPRGSLLPQPTGHRPSRRRPPAKSLAYWASLALLVFVSSSLNLGLYALTRLARAELPAAALALEPSLFEALGWWLVLAPTPPPLPPSTRAALRRLAARVARPNSSSWRAAAVDRRAAAPTFRVQRSRADYRVTVVDALRALGLAEANESAAAVERLLAPSDGGGGFDVFWGHEWGEHAAFFDSRLRPHMMVSSVMGLMAETLGDKDFLGFALQHCAAQFGGAECDFIPPIYSLPAQKTQWQRAHRAHAYWIRKDKAVWGSQGVSIVSSTKALPQESSFLLQLYVSRPLLWNGHKHDLRLWALITCAAPLRLYLLQDGWARMAARPWAGEAALGDAAKLKDDCMHLTATYCPDEPHTSLRIVRTNLARYRDGLGAGGAGGGFARALWPRVERAVLRTVLMARPLLRAYEAGLLRRGGRAYRRFAFLSYDAIIDADGRAWVEEVNTNGFLMGTRIPRGWDYTLDAMRLLGVGGYASRPYQPRLDAEIARFCAAERCADDEAAALQDLVDESEHAGQFARVYPVGGVDGGALDDAQASEDEGRADRLASAFARSFWGADGGRGRGASVATQPETAADGQRWDWFGMEGNWKREKTAVREENRQLMARIRQARGYRSDPEIRPLLEQDARREKAKKGGEEGGLSEGPFSDSA